MPRVVLTHSTQPFGITLDSQYNAADERTQVVDNKGGQTDTVYDGLGRLSQATLSGSGVTGTKTKWNYDATTGDLASLVRQSADGSGGFTASGSTAYGYDALGRNDSVTQTNGSGVTVGSYTYTRDLADRLTGSTFVTGGAASSHSFSYYDDNQLMVADGVLSKYDDGGNLKGTYNAATGAQLTSLTYGTANRLQSNGVYTYTYDDAGQMTGKSKSGESWTYGYDSNGQMVSAGNGTDAVAYTFDAFGNRLSRVQSGGTSKTERFAYDGADAFLDLNGSNAVTVRRQYGPGVDNLLSRQSGGSVEWYGTDAQGSVRQVFDNKGKQTSWADYEAHGALVGGGSLTDRYGFTGRELDGLTGQQYNRARVLDGQSWTSEDPMGFAAGDANLRRYVGNSPTNGTDSSGFCDDTPAAAVPANEGTKTQTITFDPSRIDGDRIREMIANGEAIEHNGLVIVVDKDPNGGIRYYILKKFEGAKPAPNTPRNRESTLPPKPLEEKHTYYRVVHYVQSGGQLEDRNKVLQDKEYARKQIDRYVQSKDDDRNDRINQIVYRLVLDSVPGMNTVDKAQNGNGWEIALAIAEDGSTLLLVGGLIKGSKAGKTMFRVSSGLQAAEAGIQGVRGGIEIANGDTTNGMAHLGDATLRLMGLSAAQIALLRKARTPLAKVFDGHVAEQGFTGVYDKVSGKILIKPSTAASEVPTGWVSRGGGHAAVSGELGGKTANHQGFAVILQKDGTLAVTWRSGVLNSDPNNLVPQAERKAIVEAIEAQTGKKVSSN